MKKEVDELVKILKRNLKPVVDGEFRADEMEDMSSELGFSLNSVIYRKDSKEMVIITPDRPEKSAVIGKGGWVVGRLKEELDINSIHVEAYSDILIRKYRMKQALGKIKHVLKSWEIDDTGSLENLADLVDYRIKNIYDYDVVPLVFKNKIKESESQNAVVALSGGVDSSFSLIVAKLMGFNPTAATVDPGSMILPVYLKRNIEDLCRFLKVKHEYVHVDMNHIISPALEGKFHPCGRCSQMIEKTLLDYTKNRNYTFMIYGDLLSTGAQSIICEDGVVRINLPAMLSATKKEIENLTLKYGVRRRGVYGCPFLNQIHKKYGHMRRFSIQRILRETRAGILEPGEALLMIMKLI